MKSQTNNLSSSFLNKVINFIGVGLALYGIAGLYQYFSQDNAIIKHTVRCKYCRKKIFEKVCYFFILFFSFSSPSIPLFASSVLQIYPFLLTMPLPYCCSQLPVQHPQTR